MKEVRIPRHRLRLARHAYILTSDTRDFLKLFLWQAERHADILARMSARMLVPVSASWNAGLSQQEHVGLPHRKGKKYQRRISDKLTRVAMAHVSMLP